MRNRRLRCMERSIISAAGAISYLPRWAHILALVESLVLVAILVLVDIFLPGWDWIMLLLLPIAIFVSLLIAKRKTRERKKEQLDNQSLARETDFLCKQIKKMENKMENRKQGYNPMKAVSGGAPRSEKKQTVTITEDLKVIVTANNGVYDGAEHVRFNGEFIINAKSVSLLIAALEGKNIKMMEGGYFLFNGFILGEEGAKEIANRLEVQKKRCYELEGKLSKTDDERYEAKRERDLLKDKINEFNKTRHWWERKLVIDEK